VDGYICRFGHSLIVAGHDSRVSKYVDLYLHLTDR